MLNDGPRNACYDAAIRRALSDLQASQRDDARGHAGSLGAAAMVDNGAAMDDGGGGFDSGGALMVLDIGSGTSVLSLMAARGGAAAVWGCEMSPLLCEVARRAVADPAHAPFGERVAVLHAHSDQLTVATETEEAAPAAAAGAPAAPRVVTPRASTALPRRVDLVVTELVDSGLVGEHMVRRHQPTLAAAGGENKYCSSTGGCSTGCNACLRGL
jgi:hypothetical protein